MDIRFEKTETNSYLLDISAKELEEEFNGSAYKAIKYISENEPERLEIEDNIDIEIYNIEKRIYDQNEAYYEKKDKEEEQELAYLKSEYYNSLI